MGVYDEDFRMYQVESANSLNQEREAELSAAYRESMKASGMSGTMSARADDYDMAALADSDLPDDILSPRFSKNLLIGTHDAKTGENLLGREAIEPDAEPTLWGRVRDHLDAEMDFLREDVFEFGMESGLQVAGMYEDVRNNILNTTADIAAAFGAPEEQLVRGESVVPDPQNTALAVGRGLGAYAAQYVTSRAALIKSIGQPATLMGKFGVESAAGAFADFMSDPRTDSLVDFVSSIFNQERVVAETYKNNPMLARGMLAGEGLAIGGLVEGAIQIPAAVRRLGGYADDLEQIGVDRIRRSSHKLHAGVDPEGLRGLVEYMTAKILKGANALTDGMREELVHTGATGQQLEEAWEHAAEVARMAEGQIDTGMKQMLDEGFQPIVDETLPASPKMQVGRFLEERSLQALGEPLTAMDDRTKMVVSDVLAAEARQELAKHGNANAWYKSKLDKTHELVGLMHPEVVQDPNMGGAFNFALAVTSNGQKVPDNARYALRQYEHFKNTGKFQEIGWGKEAPSMVTSFKTWNAMVDEMGIDRTLQFLNTDFTVKELKAMGFNVAGEKADAVLPGSVILGPKIGGGFFTNLQGRWDLPTFDRWWMRTWGRITGNLLQKNPDLAAEQIKQFKTAIKKSPKLVEQYGGNAKELIDADDAALEQFAAQVYNAWSRSGFKDKNKTLHRVSRSIRNRTEELIDTPSGSEQRQFMRETVNETLKKLRAQGIDLEAADLQALVWYPEQRLYDKLGSRQRTKEADYEQAYRDIVTSRGIDAGAVSRTASLARTAKGSGPTGVRQEGGRATFGEKDRAKFIRPRVVEEIRQRLRTKDPSGTSGYYGARDPGRTRRARFLGRNGRTLEAPVAAVHTPTIAVKNAYQTAQLNPQPMLELQGSPESTRLFHRAIQRSKAENKFGSSVHVYDEADYADMKLFTSEDGKSGFAVKPDGDVVSVFSEPGSNMGYPMLQLAIQSGGRKLDAFNTALPAIYGPAGMKPVARVRWADEAAPDDWDKTTYSKFNNGEPDVVMFVFDPDYNGLNVKQDIENLPYSEYGAAVDIQDEAAKRMNQ